MRVRVTHGININEVPDRIKGLIEEVIDDLSVEIDKLKAIDGLSNSVAYLPTVVAIIDDVRKNLAVADQMLTDTYAISSGLVEYYTAPNNPAPAPAPSPSNPNSELDAVSEMLSNMGEQINASQQSDIHEG